QKDTYTPMTKAEFDALPRWRQLQQRFYRRPSFVSFAVYYIVERWSQAKVLPLPYVGASYRPAAWKHFAFLATYIALFTAALVLAPAYADVTTAQALLLGMLLPFFVFMGLQSYILWSMQSLQALRLRPEPLAGLRGQPNRDADPSVLQRRAGCPVPGQGNRREFADCVARFESAPCARVEEPRARSGKHAQSSLS